MKRMLDQKTIDQLKALLDLMSVDDGDVSFNSNIIVNGLPLFSDDDGNGVERLAVNGLISYGNVQVPDADSIIGPDGNPISFGGTQLYRHDTTLRFIATQGSATNVNVDVDVVIYSSRETSYTSLADLLADMNVGAYSSKSLGIYYKTNVGVAIDNLLLLVLLTNYGTANVSFSVILSSKDASYSDITFDSITNDNVIAI